MPVYDGSHLQCGPMTMALRALDMKRFQCVVGVGLLLACAMPSAQAGIAGTPFSLTLSQAVTHDSNVERFARGRADTVSSSSVTVGFDKQYGRQSLSAAIQGSIQRYKNLDQYNNDGFDVALAFSSGIGRDGRIEVNHNSSRSLQAFADQDIVTGIGTRSRQVQTNITTRMTGFYGLYSQWKLVGNVDRSSRRYSNSPTERNTSLGGRVGLRYTPSDLLYFESGVRKSTIDYPDLVLFGFSPTNRTVGDEVRRFDLDFTTGWALSGFSDFRSQIRWTQERHNSKEAGKPDDSARDYDGLTGDASWTYTPRGKMSYLVKLARDTNNSGGLVDSRGTTVRDRLTTSLSANALWAATYKIKVRGGASVSWLKEEESQDLGVRLISESSTGTLYSANVGATYDFDRTWSIGCQLAHSQRSGTSFNPGGYTSNSVSCNGSVSLN